MSTFFPLSIQTPLPEFHILVWAVSESMGIDICIYKSEREQFKENAKKLSQRLAGFPTEAKCQNGALRLKRNSKKNLLSVAYPFNSLRNKSIRGLTQINVKEEKGTDIH